MTDHYLPGFEGNIHDPHQILRKQMEAQRSDREAQMQFQGALPDTVALHEGRLIELEQRIVKIVERMNDIIQRLNKKDSLQ